MEDIIREVDYNKYKSFFLCFYKDEYCYSHVIRPCELSYKELQTAKFYTLESAVASFNNENSLAEVLIKASLLGISLDYIDIYVKDDKERFEHKLLQQIDCHKEDISKFLEKVEYPRYYVAKNKKKTDILKWLVIDRFEQSPKTKFLSGKYEDKAIVSGFVKNFDAHNYCKTLNKN